MGGCCGKEEDQQDDRQQRRGRSRGRCRAGRSQRGGGGGGNSDVGANDSYATASNVDGRADDDAKRAEVYVAKFPYEASSAAEVQLQKGDRPQGFAFVRQLKTHGIRGYVPEEFLKQEGEPSDDSGPPPAKRELPADMRDRWREIPREQLRLTKVLGQGRFGLAHLATWTIPGEAPMPVVLKHLKELSLTDKQSLLNEASMMKDLRHENVVRLIGVVSGSEPYYVVTEFVKNGSLQDYLKEIRKLRLAPLSDKTLIDICAQICRGMAYLSGEKIVHRDLAARNVLIDVKSESPFSSVVKISDFGLARTVNKEYVYRMKHETYIATRWLALEGFDTLFSSETDVWAFGVTMAEIFRSGDDPWADMEEGLVRKRILAGRGPDKPRSMPVEVGEIMKRCCQMDKKARPTFAKLASEFEAMLKASGSRM